MIKYLFLRNVLIMYSLFVTAQEMPVSLIQTREDFVFAGTHPCTSDALYKKLISFDLEKFPVLLAYRGVSRAMMADCVTNPFKKLEYFRSGKNEIEKAVRLSPHNLDIHFVRYMAQVRIPAFLGYNNKKEDIEFITGKLDENIRMNHDMYFSRMVIEALLETSELEKINKSRLKSLSEKIDKEK